MKRLILNHLEQIHEDDFNNLQKIIHQSLYDKFIYPLFQKQNGFIYDGFLAERTSATEVTVRAGRGFVYDNAQVGNEPKYRALQLNTDLTLTLGGSTPAWSEAHETLDRYDIIVVRALDEVTSQELRWKKVSVGGAIVQVSVDKVSEQTYEVDIVEGTPDGSPSIPSTPGGWTKIAEVLVTAATGIAVDNDVADTRNQLTFPSGAINGETAYVSPAGLGTHTNLASAIAALPAGGGSVLIMEDLTIAADITIPDNVCIRGISSAVELTLGASGKLIFDGDYSRLTNLRLKTTENINLVQFVGDGCIVDHCLFDLPASGSAIGVDVDGINCKVEKSCIFLNADGNGTSTNISSTGIVLSGVGGFRASGISGKPNAATPATKYDLSADLIELRDVLDNIVVQSNPGTITLDISVSGPAINGRDRAASFSTAFAYLYWIWNGTTLATISSILTPALGGPVLPTGYTHWAYAGAVKVNSGSFVPTRIKGSWAYYETRFLAQTALTATSEASIDLSAAVPSSALAIRTQYQGSYAVSGAGVLNAFLIFGIVSGEIYAQDSKNIEGLANSSPFLIFGNVTFPNIDQNLFYHFQVDDGGSQFLSFYVNAYQIANGGE